MVEGNRDAGISIRCADFVFRRRLRGQEDGCQQRISEAAPQVGVQNENRLWAARHGYVKDVDFKGGGMKTQD